MKLNKTLACAAIAIASCTAGGVMAAIANAHIVTYYSDESMNYIIGQSGHACKGAFSFGETSPYYTVEDMPCS